MASKEKVQQFFEAAEVVEQYSEMISQISSQAKVYFSEDDDDAIIAIEYKERCKKVIGKKLFDFAGKIYQELLTDEELDELIVIYTSPVFVRLRRLAPELSQKMIEYILQNEKMITKTMEQIAKDMKI